MATKEETYLQQRIQRIVESRGGYIRKNHGNMITKKGLSDLSFAYEGLAFYWEVKTPTAMKHKDTAPSEEQGIHCRKARKAKAITAIITSTEQAKEILDYIDFCIRRDYSVRKIVTEISRYFMERGLDDGTTY